MALTSKLDCAVPEFQPCEIVCLECDRSRLYGEVVQTVKDRQVCWVHPLALTVSSLDSVNEDGIDSVCYDLRESSDLLLPVVLFRSAFDTEVLPLIARLYQVDEASKLSKSHNAAQHQVNDLIKRLCQMHPEAF
jgi:hypothetical protein